MNDDIQYPEGGHAHGGGFSEELAEDAVVEVFEALGYEYHGPEVIGPDGSRPERTAYKDVRLRGRLEAAVHRLNPGLPQDALESALRAVRAEETPSLVEENRRIHRLLVEGVDVDFTAEDGTIKGDKVRLIDWENPDANDWLVTRQFTVVERGRNRRPDVVVFVNGLPLAVLELKNPASATAGIDEAYAQLQTYKDEIPSLFRTNAVLVASDGLRARIGSLTAPRDRFMPWRTVTGAAGDFTPDGPRENDTLLRGVFERSRFLQLVRDFVVFHDKGEGPFKIVAGYHQFHGARKALARTIAAASPDGDRKGGVIWHTQGSGKSLLMAFFAGLAVKAPELENPTLVILTDRNDLDDQLYGTFALSQALIRQEPKQAANREELRQLLNRASGGVIFTTMQKFAPERGEENFPQLTDRRNVIVIADEAHRSQYGFGSKIDPKTGERRSGFAHYLRQALPNASFVGFTGTPIESDDVNTPAVFGEYVDVYDITRAVEDGATVPIYYESRLARIELDEDEKPKIDAEIEEMLEDESLSEREKEKAKFSTVEKLVGAPKRLEQAAADLVAHLEARIDGMEGGKAMAVCMSRRICVELFDEIVRLRPDWRSDDPAEGAVKIVMTSTASDPKAWQSHNTSKRQRGALAKRARDPDDPLKLVIVRDMWLTGFDAPCMHTMYIDKPMRGHGLMQAIARVNRVFRGKPGGLVVDYIGIAQNLKKALSQYTQSDQDRTGVDEEKAEAALKEAYEIVSQVFHGHDYSGAMSGKPSERLAALGAAIDWVLQWTEREAEKETTDDGRKKARRRFQDNVLTLSKAYSLASASEYAKSIRDEVGFFQAIRAHLVKAPGSKGKTAKQRSFAVEQLIDRAVANAEIVDILSAVGMKSPDISVLSEEFLGELAGLPQRNLALEALEKLLNGEIKSRSRTNVVEARKFSERLEQAIARYHAGAVSSLEVLQELIRLAKDFKAAEEQGADEGFSSEERAFYTALAEHESAIEAMGSDKIRLIAVELTRSLQSNATVDWNQRENARARMRVLVKRILKRYGYPPDLADAAVRNVLEQAERFLDGVSAG